MPHHPEHKAKGTNCLGQEIKRGSYVRTLTDREAVVLCVLHDGDADVLFFDGTFGQAKWHNLVLA